MVYPFKTIHRSDEEFEYNKIDSKEAAKEASCASTLGLVNSDRSILAVTESVVMQPHSKKHFAFIDETRLSTKEAKLLSMKRAYNRECAERSRKRGKQLVSDLHQQIQDLVEDKNELRRSVAVMEKQLMKLQHENESLLLSMRGIQQDIISHPITEIGVEVAGGLRFSPQQHSNLQAFQMGHMIETSPKSPDYHKWLILQQLHQ
jgi:seryl-tRNA synthetase